MRRFLAVVVAVVACLLAMPGPAGAITFGRLDGNRHPSTGALIADWRGEGLEQLCSGSLIAPRVFLTASHCVEFLPGVGVGPHDVFVSFAPDILPLPTASLIRGTYHVHPQYGQAQNDPHDIAVVVLDRAVSIEPVRLPPAGLLDRLRASGDLRAARFTAVGYGLVDNDKTGGLNTSFDDGARRFVDQGFLALNRAWLRLSMNPSTGNGGTCYGDSGGPHFLGTSDVQVSLTVTGDTACRATDATYRIDTPAARSFLARFVQLP